MLSTRKVALNTGILYARMLITIFISLYATRLTLAALDTENFGIFGLINGAIAMLGFLSNSLTSATQRFMSFSQGKGEPEKVRSVFKMSVILHLIITVIMLGILEISGYFLFDGILNISANRMETAKMVYQFMVLNTIFAILATPYDAVVTSHENMLFYSVLSIAESFLKLGVAYYIYTEEHYDNLFLYGLLIAGISVLLFFVRQIYCHIRYSECSLNLFHEFDHTLFKQMTAFGAWSFLGAATSMITNYGQGIVINLFFGASINAAQGIANQINGQLTALSHNLMKALNPLLDKSAGAGNRQLMLSAATVGSKFSFFLAMALIIPVMIEMPFILKLWLHKVPEFCIIFCRLLILKSIIEFMFYPITSIIYAEGDIKLFQILNSVLTLFPLPLSYLFFYFDYPADIIYQIFIAYTILNSIITLFIARKNCRLSLVDFFRNVICRCWITFAIIFLASVIPHYYLEEGYERGILILIINVILYLPAVFFLGFNRKERSKIINSLPFKNKKAGA